MHLFASEHLDSNQNLALPVLWVATAALPIELCSESPGRNQVLTIFAYAGATV